MAQLLVNGLNVGTELTAVSLNWNGNTIAAEQLGHLESLNQIMQENTEVIGAPCIYGGLRLHRNIYHDFTFSLDFLRFKANLTSLALGVMTNFQTTGAETYFSVMAFAQNTDAGGEDEMHFTQCVMGKHHAGSWAMGDVKVSVAFRCQQMSLQGGANNVWLNPPPMGSI